MLLLFSSPKSRRKRKISCGWDVVQGKKGKIDNSWVVVGHRHPFWELTTSPPFAAQLRKINAWKHNGLGASCPQMAFHAPQQTQLRGINAKCDRVGLGANRTCENAGTALRASRPTYSWHFPKEMLIPIDSATNLSTRGTKRPAMQRKKLENVWRRLLGDVFTLLLTLHSALDHDVAISLAKIRGVESLARWTA